MDTDESVGGENGNLTPTDKAPPPVDSMKLKDLLNSPEVLPCCTTSDRAFLLDIAQCALPPTERDLEYHTSESSEARPNGSYGKWHHEASWPTQLCAESTTHHQTVDPATAERAAKSLSTSSASPLELKCSQCGITYRKQSAFDKHVENHTRPFICVFHYAGCNRTFSKKNEWKRHVLRQHICLEYYHCELPQYAAATQSATTCQVKSHPACGKTFRRKDLHREHVRRMHLLESHQEPQPIAKMQKQALRKRFQLPRKLACPVELCNFIFDGDKALDEWMEHAARHLRAAHDELEPKVEFGGSKDSCLAKWAESVKVTRIVQGSWYLNDALQTAMRGAPVPARADVEGDPAESRRDHAAGSCNTTCLPTLSLLNR